MPTIDQISADTPLPERECTPDNVQLFLYNAALWNAHRIHFDEPYARETEGYPGLVVPGPLLGDWLTQCVVEWIDDGLAGNGRLVSIEYTNRQAAYAGQRLRVGGTVSRIDTGKARVEVALWVRNDEDQIVTPGTAVVELTTA